MANLELELIEWLHGKATKPVGIELGIGDDMALVRTPTGRMLFSSDMLLDGVHFDSKKHELPAIGRKSIACCLSDCAAMAVRPLAATVSLALPGDFDLSSAKNLFAGMIVLADEFGLAIAGGDTTVWKHPLAIDVAIIAVPFDGIEPVRRSGARAGDAVYVTGPLGGSILGHHLKFTPRIAEAKVLAETLGSNLHAMMDVSDGVSLDLWRICQASGVGAVVDEERVLALASHASKELAESDNRPLLDHVLGDGEDFELLFTSPIDPDISGLPVFRVGEITESGYAIRRMDGKVQPLQPSGYVHG